MNFSNILFKLEESDYFYTKIKEKRVFDKELLFLFSGFLSSSSSVIDTMRKNLNSKNDYNEWKKFQKNKFKKYIGDKNTLHELRNLSVHQGEVLLNSGRVTTTSDGETKINLSIFLTDQEREKVGMSSKIYEVVKDIDLIDESKKYMRILTSQVWDLLVTYGKEVDPDYIKTRIYLDDYNTQHSILHELFSDVKKSDKIQFSEIDKVNFQSRNFSNDRIFEKYLEINRFTKVYPSKVFQ